MRPWRLLIWLCWLGGLGLTQAAWADFSLPYGTQGNQLDVTVIGAEHPTQPLFLWLTNQYGKTEGERALAHALARRGATVWQVDLLDSLLLSRTNDSVRTLNGHAVAALIDAGVKTGRPVVLVGLDRMAVPILRGLHHWQRSVQNTRAVAGAILLFPNLYRGTPVAGVQPQFLGIVSATNMPVMILEPERGVNRNRLGQLLDQLQTAGSPAFAHIIPDVRDYFPLHLHEAQNDTLTHLPALMKPYEARAMQQLPAQLLRFTSLLAQAPHPTRVLPIDEALEKPLQQQFGLIAHEPPPPAHNFDLPDVEGNLVRLMAPGQPMAGVTLVNFWASWCPHCVEEIPSMKALAGHYAPSQLRVLSINFKESPQEVSTFIQPFGLNFPVLLDRDGSVAKQWGVFAFPSSFLVDAQGRVRYSVNASIDWDAPKVRALIDQLLAHSPMKPAPMTPAAVSSDASK
ncbi:TlpA family protein disulfide reductase [Halothiobacillus sp. DCM-1]|uniref:TlpA family protein disulfide reductase n=1 Tax=Halothiobacillus sp. DCM-1 TaxID=3112558 RepID=UPI003253A712